MSTLPDNINYQPVQMYNGVYRQRRLPLNNITTSNVTLQANGTQLAEWKIPAGTVFNTARTILDYQTMIPAQGANTHVWAFEDVLSEVDSVQFTTGSNVYLTDLQFANNYTHVVRKLDTTQEEFQAADYTSGLYPHEILGAQVDNFFPPTHTIKALSVSPYGLAAGTSNKAISKRDSRYVRVGGADAAVVLSRSVPLSAFKGTALAMDKDYIFGVDMFIRVQLAPSSKIAYTTPSNTDAVTNAAALTVQPEIRNLTLRLAEQIDEMSVLSLRQKFMENKLTFTIPFVQGFKGTGGAGVTNIQLNLSSQYGTKLKRIVHTAFAASERLNTAYDHQNLDGAKILAFQTYMDSKPLQDDRMSCLQPTATARGMEDWRENQKVFKDSMISNSAIYNLNWLHCDTWSNPKSNVLVPRENIIEGLDMSIPRTWIFTADTPAALNHYSWATFTRHIISSPAGVDIVVA